MLIDIQIHYGDYIFLIIIQICIFQMCIISVVDVLYPFSFLEMYEIVKKMGLYS